MSTYKLHTQNYQIIKDATITIPQGLTLITGKSNNGKSSLIKSFQQLIYNTSGTTFIRHNQPNITISLEFTNPDNPSDNYTIVYTKSHKGGKYQITHNNNTDIYQKLGSSQLPQIKDITHIDKELNYNFWNQMEKPFLLSLSPKEQFDILQNSPHSSTLQSVSTSMVSDRKSYQQSQTQHQSKLELIQQQNTQYQQQLSQLPTITSLFNQITDLKHTSQHLQTLHTKYTQYQQITSQITPIATRLSQLSNIPSLDTLITLHATISTITAKYHKLQQSVYPINDLLNTIRNTQTQSDRITCLIQTYFPNCPLCNQPFITHNHTTHNNKGDDTQ